MIKVIKLLSMIVTIIVIITININCASRARIADTDVSAADSGAIAADVFTPIPSDINIPIIITTTYVERLVDSLLPRTLYAGDVANFGTFGNVSVTIRKGGRIRLRANGSELRYTVPLNVTMRLTILGMRQETEAALNVNLRTRIQIQNNWSLATTTTVDGYEWTREPALRSISLRQPADFVMQTAVTSIGAAIDQTISSGLNVRAMAAPFWRELQTPIRTAMPGLDENLWVRIEPSEVFLSPPIGHGDRIVAGFGVRAVVGAYIGSAPPRQQPQPLPNFRAPPDRTSNEFAINLFPEITFAQATAITKAAIVGETFRSGLNRITVHDVEISSAGEGRAAVRLEVTGSINGTVRLVGRAVYNPSSQVISLVDFDFDVETNSRFMGARNWFVRGIIMSRMRPHLRFPLKDKLEAARALGAETLANYRLPHGFVLSGNINNINVRGVEVRDNAFRVALVATGTARVAAGE